MNPLYLKRIKIKIKKRETFDPDFAFNQFYCANVDVDVNARSAAPNISARCRLEWKTRNACREVETTDWGPRAELVIRWGGGAQCRKKSRIRVASIQGM